MARVTLDDFIEAFSAQLVTKGQHMVRLNDPNVRDGLYRVYKFLARHLDQQGQAADKDWRRSLVNIRNVFQPSAIGSFDRFEALMRAKQVYLTDHPNPYYQDILIRMPTVSARQIIDDLDQPVSDLVSGSVKEYLAAG
ncbi:MULTISPECIES: hypothetical protein [Microvirga]|uniref:Uncharacterized protein n=2 Tax=Microvirga TaxID=186650 RepID=A0ABW9Z402_9HYPH|nr:hypothetical protein [Microvirga arsenatis]NBJ13074.1 hypothetical protein [Microvirga arsenatis]NBJ26807.1 hypothetical protein [Microvirga arsenatis]